MRDMPVGRLHHGTRCRTGGEEQEASSGGATAKLAGQRAGLEEGIWGSLTVSFCSCI